MKQYVSVHWLISPPRSMCSFSLGTPSPMSRHRPFQPAGPPVVRDQTHSQERDNSGTHYLMLRASYRTSASARSSHDLLRIASTVPTWCRAREVEAVRLDRPAPCGNNLRGRVPRPSVDDRLWRSGTSVEENFLPASWRLVEVVLDGVEEPAFDRKGRVDCNEWEYVRGQRCVQINSRLT